MFSKPLYACATVFVNYISYELTFDSDYASGYAIKSANDNGVHVLPKAMTMSLSARLSSRHIMINFDVTGTFWYILSENILQEGIS